MTEILIPTDAILSHGAHPDGEDTCARELLHLLVTGEHADKTPECLTLAIAALPRLNDGPWESDEHRTRVMLPFLPRLARCARAPEIDQRLAYRLADIAVREIAPEALDAAGYVAEAKRLRCLDRIVDVRTAAEADEAAEAAARAGWAAWSARVALAAATAAETTATAARVALDAATAAETTATAAVEWEPKKDVRGAYRTIEHWTNRILGVICEEYGAFDAEKEGE